MVRLWELALPSQVRLGGGRGQNCYQWVFLWLHFFPTCMCPAVKTNNQRRPKPWRYTGGENSCRKLVVQASNWRQGLIQTHKHLRWPWLLVCSPRIFESPSRCACCSGGLWRASGWQYASAQLQGSQSISTVAQLYLTLCDPMGFTMPGFPVHHQFPELTQTHVQWLGDAIQPSHPLSSPSPPALNLSQPQGLFKWVSSYIRWPKYWSFSFNINSSNEYLRLISFRMDWLDLLAVQGTLKSLLQHHSSKAWILLRSAFFMVQLWHPYMTTGKRIALTRRAFVGKVMSLLFNMLSRLVITFLPRSKCLLISWLQSPSEVILEPRKIKSATVSPSISHEVMRPDAMILVSWMLSFRPFRSPLSLSSRGSLVRLCFLPQGWYHLHIWGYWYFSW